MEDWSGAAARKATTVVQNNPAAVAPAQPSRASANTSDRLALVPPSQGGGSAASRPGEKGGTGNAQIAGLKQQLATAKESLTSLKQENGDLQSRVKDLEDISGKNQKLLGMKDAEIAELQRKLAEAQQQAAKSAAATPTVGSAPAASAASTPKSAASVATNAAPANTFAQANATSASASSTASSAAAPVAAPAPAATQPVAHASPQPNAAQNEAIEVPWYRQPLAWIIGGVVILGLILLGLLRRRPRPLPELESESPSLADHFSAAPLAVAPVADIHDEPAHQAPHPDAAPDEAGEEFAAPVGEEHTPAAQNEYKFNFDELSPEEPLAAPGMAAPQPPVAGFVEDTREHEAPGFAPAEEPSHDAGAPVDEDEDVTREHPVPAFSDDPVDTKLDLARAYLDMGDPAGARAMLEEVLSEGSQPQKDEAKRLLEGQA